MNLNKQLGGNNNSNNNNNDDDHLEDDSSGDSVESSSESSDDEGAPGVKVPPLALGGANKIVVPPLGIISENSKHGADNTKKQGFVVPPLTLGNDSVKSSGSPVKQPVVVPPLFASSPELKKSVGGAVTVPPLSLTGSEGTTGTGTHHHNNNNSSFSGSSSFSGKTSAKSSAKSKHVPPVVPPLAVPGLTPSKHVPPVVPPLTVPGVTPPAVEPKKQPFVPPLAVGTSHSSSPPKKQPFVPPLAVGSTPSTSTSTPSEPKKQPFVPPLAVGTSTSTPSTPEQKKQPIIPPLLSVAASSTPEQKKQPVVPPLSISIPTNTTKQSPMVPTLSLGPNGTPPNVPSLPLNIPKSSPKPSSAKSGMSYSSSPLKSPSSFFGSNTPKDAKLKGPSSLRGKPKIPSLFHNSSENLLSSNRQENSPPKSSKSQTNNSNSPQLNSTGIGLVPLLNFSSNILQKRSAEEDALLQTDTEADAQEVGGALSSIEYKILKRDPSLRFINKGQGRVLHAESLSSESGIERDRSSTFEDEITPEEVLERNYLYLSERNERKIYLSGSLHVTFLQLIFSLLITPLQTLQPLYTDQFPSDNQKLNILYLLHSHINNPANSTILPKLVEHCLESPHLYRLLKMLCTRLFQPERYSKMTRLAIGAYGTVYKCTMEEGGLEVAVKVQDISKSIFDRSVLHDMYTEILILDMKREDPRICKMFDFGVSPDYYWVVMKRYTSSLREWRLRQTKSLQENLELYMNIFEKILSCMKACTDSPNFLINHFDLKCDNILIYSNKKDDNLFEQKSSVPNFEVALADFGESVVYSSEDEEAGYTTRSKGTEFNKSPEMLNAAYSNQKGQEHYDRRKKTGSSAAADIWALGCLFYELLTGEYLFKDNDWVRFFLRVTHPAEELITPERRKLIDNNPMLLRFFKFIFIRKPDCRPSLEDVVLNFDELLKATRGTRTLQRLKNDFAHIDTFINQGKIGYEPPVLLEVPEESFYLDQDSMSVPTQLMYSTLLGKSTRRGGPLGFDHQTDSQYFSKHVTKVTDTIYFGNGLTAKEDKALLKEKFGITHALCCSDLEANPSLCYDFEYLYLPLNPITNRGIQREEVDFESQQQKMKRASYECFERILVFVEATRKRQGKVFIHNHGRSTDFAVAVVIAYLMETKSMTYVEAFNTIQRQNYSIKPNYSFFKSLHLWLPRQMSKTIASPRQVLPKSPVPKSGK